MNHSTTRNSRRDSYALVDYLEDRITNENVVLSPTQSRAAARTARCRASCEPRLSRCHPRSVLSSCGLAFQQTQTAHASVAPSASALGPSRPTARCRVACPQAPGQRRSASRARSSPSPSQACHHCPEKLGVESPANLDFGVSNPDSNRRICCVSAGHEAYECRSCVPSSGIWLPRLAAFRHPVVGGRLPNAQSRRCLNHCRTAAGY